MSILKRSILFLTCIVFAYSTKAQDTSSNKDERVFKKLELQEIVGKPFTDNRSHSNIIELGDQGYWSYSSTVRLIGLLTTRHKVRHVVFAKRYDKKMNLVVEKRVRLPYKTYKIKDFHGIRKVGEEFYILFTIVDKKRKKENLYAALFDPIELEMEEKPRIIASVRFKKLKTYTRSEFEIKSSKNSEYLMVTGISSKKRRKIRKIYSSEFRGFDKIERPVLKSTFWVFDESMRKVNYRKNYKVTVKDSKDIFYVDQMELDSKGNVYFLAKKLIVKKIKRSKSKRSKIKWENILTKAEFVIEKLGVDGDTLKYVSKGNEYLMDVRILIDNQERVQLMTYFGERSYNRLVGTGLRHTIFNKRDLTESKVVETAFDPKVLLAVNDTIEFKNELSERNLKIMEMRKKKVKQKAKSKADKVFNERSKDAALRMNFISYFNIDKNDNAYAAVEEYRHRVVTKKYTDANGNSYTTTTHYYDYNDFILTRFIGDSLRQEYLKKQETYVNKRRSGFFRSYIQDDGDLQLVIKNDIYVFDSKIENIRKATPKILNSSSHLDVKPKKYRVKVLGVLKGGDVMYLMYNVKWFNHNYALARVKVE